MSSKKPTPRLYFRRSVEELEITSTESNDLDACENFEGESDSKKTEDIQKSEEDSSDTKSDAQQDASQHEDILQPIDLEDFYTNNINDVNDETVSRLSCWTALEALSPQCYQKPEDLGSGDKSCIAKLNAGLPWTKNQPEKPNYTLYYEIILGSIDMERATEKLVALFGQDEEKQRRNPSKAVIASILVDKEGCVLEEGGIAISSFAWALPLSLKKRFDVLNAWPDVEKALLHMISKYITRYDPAGKPRPLDVSIIESLYQWLIGIFELPDDLVHSTEFAVRRYYHLKDNTKPTCALLNSFFIEDLSYAIKHHQEGTLGSALTHYLGSVVPTHVKDVLSDNDTLEEAISPSKMPLARWPMGSDRALALLQQAAVNVASDALKEDGILSVNGPPGTGKTTLLRDVIADVMAQRANAMCGFENPNDAFIASGQNVPSGGKGFWQIYTLDKAIKGYEIVVASSNNAAVENISHELPDLHSVAREDAAYFRTVSDAIAKTRQGETASQSWGLIAAALGNSKNRSIFSQVFWWDQDAAMRLYLKAAKGDNVIFQVTDKETGKVIEKRDPHIVTHENPPRREKDAIESWHKARKKFLDLQEEIKKDYMALEDVRALCLELSEHQKLLAHHKDNILQCGAQLAEIMPSEHYFHHLWIDLCHDFETNITLFMHDKKIQPYWINHIFKMKKGRIWQEIKQHYRLYCAQRNQIKTHKLQLDKKRSLCGEHIIDADFFAQAHEDKQIAAPWLSEQLHAKREDFFLAALDVHKAFIDASAQKMLHNLSVLMGCFQGNDFSDPDKKALKADLWSTLCLVVPVISTAFASVNRMLGDLPPESLGWLLIDEAGQALPQAAVGAIMRAKRAMIVGDPMQIQPVVTLPDRLSKEICKQFHVNHDIWVAPNASAQTLADRASSYQSKFDIDFGMRLVGMPLLVHRRCEEPMFSISNEAAYNNLMVSQVPAGGGGDIRNILGVSQWCDVEGHADNKWCAKEGETVISLLKTLRAAGLRKPDLFIITPFRIVAQEMRSLLQHEAALLSDLGIDIRQFVHKNVGTVHTFQGREADTVIFLLGAPMASQHGSRYWAGAPENLLNVAVSRAKRNLYVVGSWTAWSNEGSFSILSKYLK